MGRKPRVQRSAGREVADCDGSSEERELAETCRKYEIAPDLFYRWKDEVERVPWLRLGEKRSRPARCRAGETDQTVGTGAGAIAVADRDLKKRAGRVSCGQAHSSARELVAQGSEAKLVAETLAISRSSLVLSAEAARRRPTVRGSRKSSWPVATSRRMAIAGWLGGWGAIKGW